MAVDMFLIIDTIKGESRDKTFSTKGAMDVLSWSWGLSNSGSMHVGGGGGSGKVNVQDLHVTKYLDRASPNLMQSMCDGKHYKTASLTARKSGGKQEIFYVVSLEEVMITSLSTGGSGGEDRFTENLSMNFSKFKVDYTPQKQDGTMDGVVPMNYDIALNSKA